jgi:inosine/xanthosine triphosphatase
MKIAVGSANPAKIRSVQSVTDTLFPGSVIQGVKTESGVSEEPMSAEEMIEGAINRAKRSRDLLDADYGIGMEGGHEIIGERQFVCGFIAVVDRSGKIGIGASSRMELPQKIVKRMKAGEQFHDIVDDLSGEDAMGTKQGLMGILSNGHISREVSYAHGLIFAFSPFISDKKYWE